MVPLLRKTRQPAEAGPTEEAVAEAPVPYTSQAFELWDRESRPGGKRHVLDLGMAVGDNVRYFGEDPCRLEIVGLSEGLPIRVPVEEDEDREQREAEALEALLPDLPPRSQHGALCWDVLDYLTRPQIAALGRWLARVLALDAVALLSLHTGETMPPAPGRYVIQGALSLARVDADGQWVRCPRLTQGDLKRLWPDFEVLRSYLLRSEAQEFVLRRV